MAADFVYTLVTFAILTPLLGTALRAFVSFSGEPVLADQDILLFVLSPWGLVTLVVIGAAAIAITGIEQACFMTLGFAVVRGRDVRVVDALLWAARHAGSIWSLVARLVVRVLVLAAPFLLASAGVFAWLLTEHDINFYLSERPPAFWVAATIIFTLTAGVVALLVPRLAGWIYALPIHLFERPQPARAIAASVERAKGEKRTILVVLVGWGLASVLFSAVAFGAVGVVGRLLVPRAQSSMVALLFVVGGLFLLWGALNFIVTFVQASWFALLVVRLYDSFARSPDTRLPDEREKLSDSSRPWRSPKAILAFLLLVIVLAGLSGYFLIDGVRTEDDVVVIAHRGASGRAPENTLAAVRAAIEDGADFVEIDVQETADGEVVVIHDSDFMKIAGDPRKVWDIAFQDARAIDIGSWFAPAFGRERLPLLAEVLDLARGNAQVDIELKYYGHDDRLEERVVDVVEAADMAADVVIMSLEQASIRKVRALRPEWTIGLLAATAVGDLTRVDADFLAVHSALATRRFVGRAHAAGKEVYVWTVNDPIHMSRLISRGVDGLITDEPALARRILAERAELGSVERLFLEAAYWLGAVPDEPSAAVDVTG